MLDMQRDTIITPSDSVRKAIAETGDGVYRIHELEILRAALFGKEAALCTPSGTFGNQSALCTWCKPRTTVILGKECHIFQYETDRVASCIPTP